MLIINEMAKQLSKGVFWLVNDELLAFPFYDSNIITAGISKSGDTYNHKKLWKELGYNKSYNYYPRGRVDINNRGVAVIYMNPNIDDKYISQIKKEFGITGKYRINYDYSNHYKCYLDDGWKADNSI